MNNSRCYIAGGSQGSRSSSSWQPQAHRAGNRNTQHHGNKAVQHIAVCEFYEIHCKQSITTASNHRHGVSNYRSIECLFRLTTTKQHRSRLLCLCGGNPPVTGGFRAQEESYAEMFPFDDIIIENVNEQRTEFLAELRMLQRMESLPEYKFFETGLLLSGGQAVFNIYKQMRIMDFHLAMSSNIIYNAIQVTFVIQWNLSMTTTSIIKSITCDLFSNVF